MSPDADGTQRIERTEVRNGEQRRVTVEKGTWTINPTQIVAWVASVYLVVTGLVAIARAGFDQFALFDPIVSVGGLPHTPLLGIIELVLGLLLLYAGIVATDGPAVTFIGGLMFVFGLVWLIEPTAFEPYLGVTSDNGLMYAIVGVILLIGGLFKPLVFDRPGA